MGNRKVSFFVNDWANDAGLKMSSEAAECLWLRIFMAIHDSPRPGFLLTPAGERPDEGLELMNLLGRFFSDLPKALCDLEKNKVFSRVHETDQQDPLFAKVPVGTIYQRRFIDELRRSQINAANARSGHQKRKKKEKKETEGASESDATSGAKAGAKRTAKRHADPGIGIGIGKGEKEEEQAPCQDPPAYDPDAIAELRRQFNLEDRPPAPTPEGGAGETKTDGSSSSGASAPTLDDHGAEAPAPSEAA